MQSKFKNIRTFIGAKNYEESRQFYNDLGFKEFVISDTMSLFRVNDDLGFYLQKYYVKKWVDNLMMFLEVENVDECWEELTALKLDEKYKKVRFTPIKTFEFGRECFMHDPSGVLWHFCQFN